MLDISRILKSDRVAKAMIGLTSLEFQELTEKFGEQWDLAEARRVAQQNRIRKPGGGGKPFLGDHTMRLLFILLYYRVYPTQDVMGVLFSMCQSAVCRYVKLLSPLLKATLGHDLQLPARTEISSLPELFERYPELIFLMDATERPIPRPKDSERQKKVYSGKKKRHTLKNTIVSTAMDKRVIFLGKTRSGTVHDKKAAEEDLLGFPKGSKVLGDSGYAGMEIPDVTFYRPYKKPRGRELPEAFKTYNHHVSQIRVRVEHSIAGIKRSRIARDIYRNRRKGFDDEVMEVSCGLYNYTVDSRRRSNNPGMGRMM